MSVASASAVKDSVPAAKVPGGVRSVQTDVGYPLESTSHTFAPKLLVPSETMSTPVRVYPAFEPVVNLCEYVAEVSWVSVD